MRSYSIIKKLVKYYCGKQIFSIDEFTANYLPFSKDLFLFSATYMKDMYTCLFHVYKEMSSLLFNLNMFLRRSQIHI